MLIQVVRVSNLNNSFLKKTSIENNVPHICLMMFKGNPPHQILISLPVYKKKKSRSNST